MFKDTIDSSIAARYNKKISAPPVDEAQLLIDRLENSMYGDYINNIGWSIVTAEWLYNQLSQNSVLTYIIDIRPGSAFADGHIQGSVSLAPKDILKHYQSHKLENKENVVLVCSTGQESAYCAALLQLYGFSNVCSMEFGMSAWHNFFNIWKTKLSSKFFTNWDKTDKMKPPEGDLPVIRTGKSTGQEILEARINSLLAEGFGGACINADSLFRHLPELFVVSYMPEVDYLNGHIPGAVNYVPKCSLGTTTFLKSLPQDKQIVIYSYTGHISAYAAAFLKVIGYDAKSVLYGANGMAYNFVLYYEMFAYHDNICMDYPFMS